MEKYEKIKVVGRGAFGIVHLCRRRSDGGLVILKEIPVEQMSRDERLAAQNECQVLKLLNHPNIIEYYENFLEDKALMIAMEYAPGGTLADYIQKRCNSLLDEDTILHFFVQILLALYHVHNKLILHRDLKTQNILMDKHQMIVKIGDFGISKILVSKSKAYTVVGTPCYISPELCEGKPYNQKSDIWALGCVLYELASLKRAFEAAVRKSSLTRRPPPRPPKAVFSFCFAAICFSESARPGAEDHERHFRPHLGALQPGTASAHPQYAQPGSLQAASTQRNHGAPHLHTPAAQSLHGRRQRQDAQDRETPVRRADRAARQNWRESADKQVQRRAPESWVTNKQNEASEHRGGQVTPETGRNLKVCRGLTRTDGSGAGKLHSLPLSSVYTWGSGISSPLRLPMLNTEVLQVSLGRTQKMAVTKSGRLIAWEAPSLGSAEVTLPGAVEQMQPQFIWRFLEGQSGVTVKSVSCGDLFTACMTDRGIIMTFGSGSNGCLGHGNFNDVTQPKIVEALLGYELVQVSCGASHVLAMTNEGEVFAWGRGDNGRLGLATRDTHNCPRQVPLPVPFEARRVVCGVDCSVVVGAANSIVACGSNRFNKLGLDEITSGEEPGPRDQVEEAHSFAAVRSAPLNKENIVCVDIGTAHSVAVTESGRCITFGSNQHGQMGRSSRRGGRAPYPVPGLQGVTMAACGDAFTLAITSDGEVHTWGKGARGRLGRKEEDSGIPKAVQLDESHPYTVASVACCHGNSLLAVKPLLDEAAPR